MRGGFLWRGAWLAVAAAAPLGAQDFRVELFRPQTARVLSLAAGPAPVLICRGRSPRPCLQVNPGATANCSLEGRAVRCSTPTQAQTFSTVSTRSDAPFRLETIASKAASAAPARAVRLRAAEFLPAQHGLRIIATVDLETYVEGVLAGEASIQKAPAALEAMAVVARTWALGARGRHRADGFDFCPLTHCQVFRLPSEIPGERLNALAGAVSRTSGQVLKYHGQLIDAYFSAHCGGMTEAAGAVWPDRAQPYLVSLRDPYCAGSNHSSWQQQVALEMVRKILEEDMGVALGGPLRDLRIDNKTASGRARILRVAARSDLRIDANQFRYAANRRLGWNTLKSNLYDLDREGDSLIFTGHGFGHGVGLCQAGTEQMGRLGIAYERILTHYFPGTAIGQVAAAPAASVLSSEHFELVFPPGQQPWVSETLQALEDSRRSLAARAEALPRKVRVETWETTPEFIRATGQPGWAAASNDGQSIALQPLAKLKRRGILLSTLRHELMHLAIHPRRAPGVPPWFEEGLVLYLTGEQVNAAPARDFAGRSLEQAVTKPRSEAEMKAAYAAARAKVRALARQRGEAALWQMLEHPTPADLQALK
jgi:stage II sporulation protein D